MAQYINKSALVAEIEKLHGNPYYRMAIKDVLSILDTLEVKEVDLEKAIDEWYNTKASKEFENVFYDDIEKFAKHFYELGLKAKGE